MAKKSRKKCKICNKLFTPQYSAFQATCSIEHAIQFTQLRSASNKAQMNAIRNENKGIEKLNIEIENTRKEVNAYIRLRDQGRPCVSCGVKWRANFDAGHAYSAAKFNAIRFDFNCVHGQCRGCNRDKEGNYDNYLLHLPERIGQEAFDRLSRRAKISKQVPHTWTRYELTEIRKEVRLRMRELKSKRR